MKSRSTPKFLIGALVLLLSIPGTPAAEVTPPPPSTPTPRPVDTPEKKPVPKPVYVAPKLPTGNAGPRIGGGTRGGTDPLGGKLPTLEVLAPNHVALTSQEQPTLFWYQSAPAKVAFQLTLTEPGKPKPLLKVDIDTAENAGIRALSLARQNVKLQQDVTYSWSVALVPDKANRSKDLIATGGIRRVAAPAGLAAKAAEAAPVERASMYAAAGLWYDALQAVSTAIAAEPKSAELHQRRAALLKQVGLDAAATADRQ